MIREGGVVAHATEHCFGLACDPRNPSAVQRLLRIKRRSVKKGLIVLAAEAAQLSGYVDAIPPDVARSWPGPNTWLLSLGNRAPRWVTGKHPRIAVRVTAHAQARALCDTAGPVVSTSANRAGERPTRNYRETQHRLGGAVDYILPGRVGKSKRPTTIRDAATGKTIRPG